MKKLVVLALSLIVSLCAPTYAQEFCRDVFGDKGPYRSTKVDTSTYSKMAVAAGYYHMTDEEIRESFNHGGSFSYDGFSLSGSSKGGDIRKFREVVDKSMDVEKVYANQYALYATSGDPKVVDAWSKCMDVKTGVFAYFKTRGDQANLLVEYRFPQGDAPQIKINTVELGKGVVFSSKNPTVVEDKKLVANAFINSFVEQTQERTPFLVNITVSTYGSIEGYLPAIPVQPTCEEKIVNSKVPTYVAFDHKHMPAMSVGGAARFDMNQGAELKVNSDCQLTLRYIYVAIADDRDFPNLGSAPAVHVVLNDADGFPISEKISTDSAAVLRGCKQIGDRSVTFSKITPEINDKVASFDLGLSATHPQPCN